MNLLSRISAAARLVIRGSIAPWDRVGVSSAGLTGEAVQEPYRQSVWVQAAVRHIANPIAAVDLEFSGRAGRQGRDAMIQDPRLDAFWASPAKGLATRAEFLKASVGWRKLAGESFWILDDTALVPFPEVQERLAPLILARPDRMRHVVDAGELVGWDFLDGAGRRHRLLPEQVIHLRQWNPYDEWRGLGEFEAARLAVQTDHASAIFSRSLAQANGDQGVYIVAKGGIPDDAQRAQIIAQLREKRALQQRGVFKPVFLTGDITVEDPKVRAVDAAFLDGRRMSAEEIFVAFGVPPSMTTKMASYSVGSASDYYRLILDACMPEAAELAAGISQVSSRLTGVSPLFATFAWHEHPVLQQVRKESIDALGKLCDRGMPVRLAGEYLDLGLPQFPGDDVGYLPFSVAPASEVALGPAPAAANEPATGTDPASSPDPVRAALEAIQARGVARANPDPAAEQRATSADARLWQSHMRARQGTVRAYKAAFNRVLHGARATVLRKLAARDVQNLSSDGGTHRAPGVAARGNHAPDPTPSNLPQDGLTAPETPPGGVQSELKPVKGQSDALAEAGSPPFSGQVQVRAGAADILFVLDEFFSSLKAAFRPVTESALQTAGEQLFREVGSDDPYKFPPARAIQFIRERENRLKDVSQDVFDRIKAVIEDGLNAGDTTDALAALIRGEFNAISRSRSITIAMTETAAAYGVARHEAMQQAGIDHKRWLTSQADNVRPAHRDAQGQTVPVDEPFRVGGEELMHPGDPRGSASNTINCHCVAIAVDIEDPLA